MLYKKTKHLGILIRLLVFLPLLFILQHNDFIFANENRIKKVFYWKKIYEKIEITDLYSDHNIFTYLNPDYPIIIQDVRLSSPLSKYKFSYGTLNLKEPLVNYFVDQYNLQYIQMKKICNFYTINNEWLPASSWNHMVIFPNYNYSYMSKNYKAKYLMEINIYPQIFSAYYLYFRIKILNEEEILDGKLSKMFFKYSAPKPLFGLIIIIKYYNISEGRLVMEENFYYRGIIKGLNHYQLANGGKEMDDKIRKLYSNFLFAFFEKFSELHPKPQ